VTLIVNYWLIKRVTPHWSTLPIYSCILEIRFVPSKSKMCTTLVDF